MVSLQSLIISACAVSGSSISFATGRCKPAAMVRDKGHYGRWLGIKHAGIHGLGHVSGVVAGGDGAADPL